MGKIVQGFTHQSSIQVLGLTSSLPSTSTPPPTKPLTRRTIYDRLHYLLAHILSLIPTLPSALQPFLIKHFPHKRQNQFAQLTYIRNILKVSTYCPELSDKILATIVDRAIQIDVEIQVELEELEEEDSDNGLDHDLFELDPFDVLVGQEGSEFDSDAEDALDDGLSDDEEAFSDISSDAGDLDLDKEHVELPTNVKHVQGMVKKLDGILTLLFEHFKKGLGQAGSPEATKSVTSLNELRSPSPLNLPPLPAPASPSLYSPLISLSTPPTPSSPIPTPSLPALPTPLRTLDHMRTQFHSLLSIFDRTILSTFKSRYTQFLVFWYASLDPEFVDIFQGMLVERALFGPSDAASAQTSNPPTTTNTTPELMRAAAASYIGSFVSRAKFVDKANTRRVVGVLCEYLQACLDDVDEALRAYTESDGNLGAAVGAPSQHVVFYAVAQAVLLVFCFRWRDLMIEEEEAEEEDEQQKRQRWGGEGGVDGPPESASISAAGRARKDKWIPELNVLKRVVMSVLNPLKVCSPGVVTQFAKVAHQTGFVYCYSILESNKRSSPSAKSSSSSGVGVSPSHMGPSSNSMIASSSTVSTSHLLVHPTFLRGELNNELNTFFPFDPYRLPRSGSFIQEVYREWSDVAIDGDEDDEEDEEDANDNSDSDNEGDSSDDEDDVIGASTGSSGHLAIPGRQRRGEASDDGGLGESLVAMSISPAVKGSKISESLGSTMAMSVSYSYRS
ncbi:hypothetical protein H1R20_g5334, partial [Candolleomyces eurysporus]